MCVQVVSNQRGKFDEGFPAFELERRCGVGWGRHLGVPY